MPPTQGPGGRYLPAVEADPRPRNARERLGGSLRTDWPPPAPPEHLRPPPVKRPQIGARISYHRPPPDWRPSGRVVRIAQRDGWRCRFCGVQLAGDPAAAPWTGPVPTVDHWVPKGRQGSDRIANLVLACQPCNADKGSLTGGEYLAVLAYRAAHPIQPDAAPPREDPRP